MWNVRSIYVKMLEDLVTWNSGNHNYPHWLTNTEKEKIVYAIKEELKCITKSSPNIKRL